MKVLVNVCFSLILFGVISADEERNKKKEKIVSFYKCIACAPADVQASYEKCKELKPEKAKECTEKCFEELKIPETNSEETWKHFCQNPVNIEKVFECVSNKKDELKKSLTEEDVTAFKKFKECAKSVRDQYCSE